VFSTATWKKQQLQAFRFKTREPKDMGLNFVGKVTVINMQRSINVGPSWWQKQIWFY